MELFRWGGHRSLWMHDISEFVAAHPCRPCPIVYWGTQDLRPIMGCLVEH